MSLSLLGIHRQSPFITLQFTIVLLCGKSVWYEKWLKKMVILEIDIWISKFNWAWFKKACFRGAVVQAKDSSALDKLEGKV